MASSIVHLLLFLGDSRTIDFGRYVKKTQVGLSSPTESKRRSKFSICDASRRFCAPLTLILIVEWSFRSFCHKNDFCKDALTISFGVPRLTTGRIWRKSLEHTTTFPPNGKLFCSNFCIVRSKASNPYLCIIVALSQTIRLACRSSSARCARRLMLHVEVASKLSPNWNVECAVRPLGSWSDCGLPQVFVQGERLFLWPGPSKKKHDVSGLLDWTACMTFS